MFKPNPYYDLNLVIKYGCIMAGFFMACKLTKGLVYPVILPFALYYMSMRKFEELFFVVLIAISSIICNDWIMPKPFLFFGLPQRGLLVSLGYLLMMSVSTKRIAPEIGPLRGFLWYVVYMIFVSFVGWSPLISGLKLFLFFSAFFAFFATMNNVAQQSHGMKKMRCMILAVIGFFAVGSILVIPFPAISQMNFEQIESFLNAGFELPPSMLRGVTVHSQTLGPIIAVCGVLIFGDLVFSIQRMDRVYMVILLSVVFLLIKTASRTAMGGFLAGVLFVFWCSARTRTVKRSWRSKLSQTGLLMGAIGIMVALIVPSVRERIARFVVKYSDAGESVNLSSETILSSRQHMIDRALHYWSESPAIGNGFQVSPDMKGFHATSIKQVMTAPVEKSTWIYAILEEGGVIGEIIFCIGTLFVISKLLRKKAYIGCSCFFSMIVLNMGEFTMFSMSGIGGFIWGLIFVACAMDARRLRDQLGFPARGWSWSFTAPPPPMTRSWNNESGRMP